MSRFVFTGLLCAFVVATLGQPGMAEESLAALKKGDRIVFLGDSITQGGDGHDKGFVRLIRKTLAEKHPDMGIEVIGAGISGNKVPDLQRRLDRDVISKKPTLVVIYIGINDVWHGEKNPARGTLPEAFEAGLKDVVHQCQEAGAQVVLCTPSVIGEKADGSNNLDQRLDQYAGISRGIATEMKLPLCDLRAAFINYLKEHNQDNKPKGVLTGDGVHLNDAGNQLVADTMLQVIDK
jgi:lysophospholipase L1-like esterase